MLRLLRVSLRSGWIAVLLLAISVWGALAQGNGNRPKLVTGELLIGVSQGTARATVDAVAANLGGAVVYSFGALGYQPPLDVYQVRMQGAQTEATTLAAVAKAKQDVRVKAAWPNTMHYILQGSNPTVTPNDPRFNEQWDMTQIRMPEAWALEKGKPNVVVAVIDTGTDIDHPDIDKSRLFNPYNAITGSSDPRPDADPLDIHGTLTAGFIGAHTDNGIGIAGIGWEGVRLMPILANAVPGGFTAADLTKAVLYVNSQRSSNPNLRFVCNMSLGGDVPSDTPPTPLSPDEQAIMTTAQNGVVFSISAGNSGLSGNPASTPAYLCQLNKNILSVAATSELRTKASYSTFRPYTTIAAPGGDAPAQGRGILGLTTVAQGSYVIEPTGGTSSAAPHVAGVAALLLSVPGVNPGDVRDVITSTAQRVSGLPVPSPELGYGILDAYEAIKKVAISVTVVTPDGSGGKNAGKPGTPLPVETLRPEIRIHVSQITPDKLTIKVDGTTIPQCDTTGLPAPCYTVENVTATTTDTSGNTVPLSYDAVIRNLDLSPGGHVIEVIGVKPSSPADITVTDTRNFTIEPHLVPAGRAMISIPYYQPVDGNPDLSVTPETYFGNDFRLARWVPEQERYAFWSSFGVHDPYASFSPPDVTTHQDGDTRPRDPIGLAYWTDTESAKPVLTHGTPLTDKAFVIPLKGNGSGSDRFISWNMIGDPFPYDVPFNSVLVDTPTGRISITEAVTRGLILPNIFSFDTTNGYTYRTLPDGALRAWQGHWIGVTSQENINLVVPPSGTQSRSAAIGASTPLAAGGWMLRLSAHVKNLHDTFNFIGVSSRAADGYGREDTPKPPMSAPYVSVGLSHSDWGRQSGLYAADVKSAGGIKTWTVSVDTDQTNASVTLNWAGRTLPRDYKLTMKDETSGQVVDMRTRSSITFNTGSTVATRKFTVTAKQGSFTPLRINNVAVQPSRAAGGSRIGFTMTADATYEVKVLSGVGSTVSTLTSRAASAGDVNLYWNGKDAGGKSVASGNYLVQIRAATADGESVKVIYPFAIVR